MKGMGGGKRKCDSQESFQLHSSSTSIFCLHQEGGKKGEGRGKEDFKLPYSFLSVIRKKEGEKKEEKRKDARLIYHS